GPRAQRGAFRESVFSRDRLVDRSVPGTGRSVVGPPGRPFLRMLSAVLDRPPSGKQRCRLDGGIAAGTLAGGGTVQQPAARPSPDDGGPAGLHDYLSEAQTRDCRRYAALDM